MRVSLGGWQISHAANKSLQGTFDPPATFAAAKAPVASNAPEFRRMAYAVNKFTIRILDVWSLRLRVFPI